LLWKAHLLAGSSTGIYVGSLISPENILPAALIGAGAALLPDIDHPNSKVGQIIPLVSWTIRLTAGHRGIFHSLLGAAAVTAIISGTCVFFNCPYSYKLLMSVILSALLSHIVLDSFNPMGCCWFYPLKMHLSIPILHSGGFIEKLIINPIMFVLLLWLVYSRVITV